MWVALRDRERPDGFRFLPHPDASAHPPPGAAVTLRLGPEDGVVQRTLPVPAAALSGLPAVLAQDLDSWCPWPAEAAWYGFCSAPPSSPIELIPPAEVVPVRLCAIGRESVAPWLEALRQSGWRPVALELLALAPDGESALPIPCPLPDGPPAGSHAAWRDGPFHRRWGLLAATAAVLVLAGIILTRRPDSAAQRPATPAPLPAAVATLEAISCRLGPETRLESLLWEGETITLHGESRDRVALVARLATAPLFTVSLSPEPHPPTDPPGEGFIVTLSLRSPPPADADPACPTDADAP